MQVSSADKADYYWSRYKPIFGTKAFSYQSLLWPPYNLSLAAKNTFLYQRERTVPRHRLLNT